MQRYRLSRSHAHYVGCCPAKLHQNNIVEARSRYHQRVATSVTLKRCVKKTTLSEWLSLQQLLANIAAVYASPRRGAGSRGDLAAASPRSASLPPTTVTSQNVSLLRGSAGEEAVRAEQLPAKCADAVLVAHPSPQTLEDHRRRVV